METTPLILNQARAICRDYQHLVGKPLDKSKPGKGKIDCVAVAPFDKLNKWLFAHLYADGSNALQALQFYKYTNYSVIVLSLVPGNEKVSFKDLNTYLEEQDMELNLDYYDSCTFKGLTPAP